VATANRGHTASKYTTNIIARHNRKEWTINGINGAVLKINANIKAVSKDKARSKLYQGLEKIKEKKNKK